MKREKKKITRRKFTTPKECILCKENKELDLFDAETMRRFLTERGKIIGRVRTGLCAKHQKRLTASVKHARYLALLPYVASA